MVDGAAGEPVHEAPGLDAWQAWTPAELAARLEGVDVPWCVVGGWSIDLFLGAQTRPHGDLEIAVPRAGFDDVRRALRELDVFAAGDGRLEAVAPGRRPPPGWHQRWFLDARAGAWRVDVMLEPGDAATWVYRRDPAVVAPRSSMVGRTRDGIPYLLPHGTLLYKAKAQTDKDEADLSACLPLLGSDQRAWLAGALSHAHPGHPWCDLLGPAGDRPVSPPRPTPPT